MSLSILALPRFGQRRTLDTDTCHLLIHLRSSATQQNRHMRSVVYPITISSALETVYFNPENECFAVVKSVCTL